MFVAHYSARLRMTGTISRDFSLLLPTLSETDKYITAFMRTSGHTKLFSKQTTFPVFSGKGK